MSLAKLLNVLHYPHQFVNTPYHRVGNHCELNKNCHYDKDRLGRLTGDITCVVIVRGHTQETHSHSNSGSNYVGTTSSLTQIPSKVTDYPGNDPSVIQVHVTSAKKDVTGAWHVRDEITNTGKDTLQFVRVTVHFYDSSGELVGDSSCCYTTPNSIDPNHTATFDSFAMKDEITATPSSFKLSYDWQ